MTAWDESQKINIILVMFDLISQEVVQTQPIPSLTPSQEKGTDSKETREKEESEYAHTKAAIDAITKDDFDIVTPTLPPSSMTSPVFKLESLGEDEEEEQQPKTLGYAMTQQGYLNLPPGTGRGAYTRMLSVATAPRSMRHGPASLVDVPRQQGPGFYRSVSVQPLARSNTIYGSNIQDVEKVLFRMADAIKKDLQLS